VLEPDGSSYLLEANRHRVQRLTGREVWMFIVARVLIAFGLGVLAAIYAPSVAVLAAWPAIGVGLVFFALAARGLLRKPANPAGG
jgi:hypothetical protein